jgi:hypothetical protein
MTPHVLRDTKQELNKQKNMCQDYLPHFDVVHVPLVQYGVPKLEFWQ